MINELRLIENIDILLKSKIVIYGAGYYGWTNYNKLTVAGIPISYICDRDPGKWNDGSDGMEIISPERLKEIDKGEDIAIIVAAQAPHAAQIMDDIEKLELKTDKILTLLGLEILFVQNAYNPKISEEVREYTIQFEKLKKEAISLNRNLDTACFRTPHILFHGILIYLPQKVGSTTIENSLRMADIDKLKAHYYARRPFTSYFKESFGVDLSMLKKNKSNKIISLVREPISRGYSSLFYEMGRHGAYIIMSNGDSFVDSCAEALKTEVFELSDWTVRYGHEFDWFDHEMKSAFGIDVFEHPFDKEKGYSIIKQDNIEILLMKLEKLNSLESVIGEFVGAPHFKLVNANEGSDKTYKNLYKNVREVIKIPREVVDLYYKDNPRMDHFYTEEEKAGFLKKWESNIAD